MGKRSTPTSPATRPDDATAGPGRAGPDTNATLGSGRWEQMAATYGPQPAAYLADESPARPRDVATPVPAGRGGYRAREIFRVALGLHPTGIAELGDPAHTCGDCGNREMYYRPHFETVATHHKCRLTKPGWTPGRATDVLARWPACTYWRAVAAKGGPR